MLKLGIVFGSYAPMHQGHLECVYMAKKQCDKVAVFVCGRQGDKGYPNMPVKKRYQMVREFFDGDNLVDVHLIDEIALNIPEYPNGWERWLEEIDYVRFVRYSMCQDVLYYVGDDEYAEGLHERGREVVKIERELNPVSATMIRHDPIKYWNKMVPTFRRVFTKNILISGTASEGKTALVQDLGRYFNVPTSYEYAREYMKEKHLLEEEFTIIDYYAFLHGQYEVNRSMIESPGNRGVCIADTDAIVTKMYASFYLDDPNLSIGEEEYKKFADTADYFAKAIKWDKIFLFAPTLGFEDDGVRYMEHGTMENRVKMFNKLVRFYRFAGLSDRIEILGTVGQPRNYWSDFLKVTEYISGYTNA